MKRRWRSATSHEWLGYYQRGRSAQAICTKLSEPNPANAARPMRHPVSVCQRSLNPFPSLRHANPAPLLSTPLRLNPMLGLNPLICWSLLTVFLLTACASRPSISTPEERDTIFASTLKGQTQEQIEQLFEWVRNYGRSAGYTGPFSPIPDSVVLPQGQLVWRRFHHIATIHKADLPKDAQTDIEKKLRHSDSALYSRRECDRSMVVFFRQGVVSDYILF